MNQEKWNTLKSLLAEVGIKPDVSLIHAGDKSKPTGEMVRISSNVKFFVPYSGEEVVVKKKHKAQKPSQMQE
jgi:hypothetical protein